VLRAVRQLNLGLRVALVLQDAAGLAPHRAAQIMGIPVEKHAAVLDAARRGFMRYLDEGMGADAAA
jgi:DNA-directed RNA polymerase specialized sigma24 family protein